VKKQIFSAKGKLRLIDIIREIAKKLEENNKPKEGTR
jgi:hypothetical protein